MFPKKGLTFEKVKLRVVAEVSRFGTSNLQISV